MTFEQYAISLGLHENSPQERWQDAYQQWLHYDKNQKSTTGVTTNKPPSTTHH